MNISIEEFEKLKERIEKLEKLVNSHEKELKIVWTNPSINERPSIDDVTILENPKIEICILHQSNEYEHGVSWIENNFESIGIKMFSTEQEALNYLNGDTRNMDHEHYMAVCSERKLYLHNIEKNNSYKRLRRTSEGKYYIKK